MDSSVSVEGRNVKHIPNDSHHEKAEYILKYVLAVRYVCSFDNIPDVTTAVQFCPVLLSMPSSTCSMTLVIRKISASMMFDIENIIQKAA
jgi:hypothetical protein